MANSLKIKLSKLRHDGHITNNEYQEFIKKIDGHDRELKDQVIDQILSWCFDNSFVDYTEEYSDNGDCLVVYSRLANYLEEMKEHI